MSKWKIWTLLCVTMLSAALADHFHNLNLAWLSGISGGWLFGWLFGQQQIEKEGTK